MFLANKSHVQTSRKSLGSQKYGTLETSNTELHEQLCHLNNQEFLNSAIIREVKEKLAFDVNRKALVKMPWKKSKYPHYHHLEINPKEQKVARCDDTWAETGPDWSTCFRSARAT